MSHESETPAGDAQAGLDESAALMLDWERQRAAIARTIPAKPETPAGSKPAVRRTQEFDPNDDGLGDPEPLDPPRVKAKPKP